MSSRDFGFQRGPPVHPRGPRKKQVPVMAGCAHSVCMSRPAPTCEVLGRGEITDANLKQNTNPETHEINTNEKGCPPRLPMEMQLQIQDQKLQV